MRVRVCEIEREVGGGREIGSAFLVPGKGVCLVADSVPLFPCLPSLVFSFSLHLSLPVPSVSAE